MTRSRQLRALASFALLWTCGCRAAQVAHDGMNFRQALLEMYTDQVMDNLIRARTDQPFVQLEYKDLLVQVTDQYFGELSNNQQLTDDKQFQIIRPVTGMLTRTLQNTFNVHGSAQRQGQMSFHADPITDRNDIYENYLRFAKDPGLLVVSECPPPKGVAHIQRKYDHHYFWVPVEVAPLFQDLVLKTTFMKGPETNPPAYYEVKIVSLFEKKPKDHDPTPDEVQSAYLRLNKKIPKGDGWMNLTLPNGRKVRLRLFPVNDPDVKPPVDKGDPTDVFQVRWKFNRDQITDADLQGAVVRIYSDDYPPDGGGSDVTEEIRHDVNRIRSSLSPFMRTGAP